MYKRRVNNGLNLIIRKLDLYENDNYIACQSVHRLQNGGNLIVVAVKQFYQRLSNFEVSFCQNIH